MAVEAGSEIAAARNKSRSRARAVWAAGAIVALAVVIYAPILYYMVIHWKVVDLHRRHFLSEIGGVAQHADHVTDLQVAIGHLDYGHPEFRVIVGNHADYLLVHLASSRSYSPILLLSNEWLSR